MGVSMPRRKRSWKKATISSVSPAGPTQPFWLSAATSKPSSRKLGTSGCDRARSADATASGLMLPDAPSPPSSSEACTPRSICPASRACATGPPPV